MLCRHFSLNFEKSYMNQIFIFVESRRRRCHTLQIAEGCADDVTGASRIEDRPVLSWIAELAQVWFVVILESSCLALT